MCNYSHMLSSIYTVILEREKYRKALFLNNVVFLLTYK